MWRASDKHDSPANPFPDKISSTGLALSVDTLGFQPDKKNLLIPTAAKLPNTACRVAEVPLK